MVKFRRIAAIVMMLAMLMTAMPMSGWAAEADPVPPSLKLIAEGGYELQEGHIVDIIDGKDESGHIDHEINYTGNNNYTYGASDIYEEFDDSGVCLTPKGLSLDWSDADFSELAGDYGYTLYRDGGEYNDVDDYIKDEVAWKNEWEQMSMWDGGRVRVLIVYPKVFFKTGGEPLDNPEEDQKIASDLIKKWLTEEAPKGDETESAITSDIAKYFKDKVNTIVLDDKTNDADDATGRTAASFNGDPRGHLFNEKGQAKYDVVIFGTWDGNGGFYNDLTTEAAAALREFAEMGHGVIFGHDTLTTQTSHFKSNFNSFANDLGISLMSTSQMNFAVNNGFIALPSKQAVVCDEGLLTSFPYTLTGTLNIPETHVYTQIAGGSNAAKVYMRLKYADESSQAAKYAHDLSGSSLFNEGETSDFYLATNNNLAMIQTGHSDGNATDDERKIFANAAFHVMQKGIKSFARDGDFVDKAKPEFRKFQDAKGNEVDEKLNVLSYNRVGGKTMWDVTVDVKGKDNATPFRYRVEAEQAVSGTAGTVAAAAGIDIETIDTSNSITVNALSALRGFIVEVNDNPTPSAKDIIDKRRMAENSRIIELNGDNDVTADDDTLKNIPLTLESGSMYYAHIIPVDNAYNCGDMKTITIDLTTVTEIKAVDKTPYEPSDDADEPYVKTDDGYVKADAPATVAAEVYDAIYDRRTHNPDPNAAPEDKWISDSDVVIETTLEIADAYADKDVYGVLTIHNDNRDVFIDIGDSYKNIDPSQIDPAKPFIFPIELISDKDDFEEDFRNGDCEYTATLIWYCKEGEKEAEPIAEDEAKFIIKQPEFEVIHKYNVYDLFTKSDAEQIDYVKYGDSVERPTISERDFADGLVYTFKEWEMNKDGGNNENDIVNDTIFTAKYDTAPITEIEIVDETPYDPKKRGDDSITKTDEGYEKTDKVTGETELFDAVYDRRTHNDGSDPGITDEWITDPNVIIDVNVEVDDEYKNFEIIGKMTVRNDNRKDDDPGKYLNLNDIDDRDDIDYNRIKPSQVDPDKPFTFPIDKVSKTEDFEKDFANGDCEYTTTIEWFYIDREGKEVKIDDDEARFIIKRPEFRVTHKYSKFDNFKKTDAEIIEFVKYGDPATKRPTIRQTNLANTLLYTFWGWDMVEGGESYERIVDDTVFVAKFTFMPAIGPDDPTQPTQPEPTKPTQPTQPTQPDDKKPEDIRIGGKDRIETAIDIAEYGWDKAKVVIIARDDVFADAMAGVPLATALDAPILLTANGPTLEKPVLDCIAKLGATKVYILGQTVAVNANIENQLKALYEVERVGGKDRFGTSYGIANEMEEINGKAPGKVYFVRSDLYADALSISSVAGIQQNPILYVAPHGKLDSSISDYAKKIGKATIVGGTAAVSETAEKNIKAISANGVDRVWGADRYSTSVKVNTKYNELFTGDGICLATGRNFPDALTGGAFAAKYKLPVLLVDGKVTSEQAAYLGSRPASKLFIFGGEKAVSNGLVYEAVSYMKYPLSK